MDNVNTPTKEELAASIAPKKPFIPLGVLNHSVNDDGLWAHVVIMDKDGIPKPLDMMSVKKDTSVQVFDPDNGDTLLEYTEGADEVIIRSMANNEENPLQLSQVIEESFYEVTVNFLKNLNETEQRYFIIQDHNDTIDGVNMDEAFKRRHHLAELLDGVPEPTDDQLANWLDRNPDLDVLSLTWDNAKPLSGAELFLNLDCVVTEGVTGIHSTMAIVWRTISGKPVGELLQVNLNPGGPLAGTLNGQLTVNYQLSFDEHVERVMMFTQVDDTPMTVELYDIAVMQESKKENTDGAPAE